MFRLLAVSFTSNVTLYLPSKPGTANETGIGILASHGIIKNASLLISNDTGFFHSSQALGTHCIVIFTMTSRNKNTDPIFHDNATILSPDLECYPCQFTTYPKPYWLSGNCSHECRSFFNVHGVIEKADEYLDTVLK